MHLITLRIISNISVLVIAATLSTVGAGKCPPEGLESNRSDRSPLAGEGKLARRPDSFEGEHPSGRAGNRTRCGSVATPGRGKRGKKKAGIQRTRLIQHQLRSSYPGLAVVYFGPQTGSSRTGKFLTGASEAGFCSFTGLGHCGSHLVVIDQEEFAAVRTLDRYLSMGV